MSRTIALSGLPEEQTVTLDVAETIDGTTSPAQRLTHRVPRRQRYVWQGVPVPPPPDGEGGDGDDDSEGGDPNGGGQVTGDDPGNPADHIAAEFIGPSGAKVPDLSAIYVTATRKGGPAPCGVAFQLRSTDPNFWAFAMFGTAEWTFSADPLEDYPFRHLDGFCAGEKAGTAQGIYVAHTYEQPGTHSWSVTLRYPGLAPRTITDTAILITRSDLPPYLRRADVDVPNWLGMTKGSRAYTMTGVTTGGRINVTMTNGHGAFVLRNIELANGATATDVAAAIVAASAKGVAGTQIEFARAAGISFAASGATLTASSSCLLGTTTIAISAGDAAGVTWAGTAPDFSVPAPADTAQTLYSVPSGVATGGAVTLTFTNGKGTVNLGAIYLPSGATPVEVVQAIINRAERNSGALNAIGIATGQKSLRNIYRADVPGARIWIKTTDKAIGATTITLGVPSAPAGVTWATTAPDMSLTVPAATGGSVGGIVVESPDTFFAGRTVYASTAYPDGLALKAAAASLGIPGDLADDRYYGGPEAYYDAANARGEQSGNPWRILLHAGQTYTIATRGREPKTVNTYVGRFGTGANPIVTIADTWGGAALLNYQDRNKRGWGTFVDIDFLGLYDSANPPYTAGWMGHLFQCNLQENYGLTLHRCIMSGWRTIISVTAGGMMAPVVSDSLLTSWYDFGMYANAIHAGGFAGVAIKQKLGTINVGRKSTATADVGDRYMHPPAAKFTSLFDWSLEPAGGPPKKKAETVIPPGYEAPATGGWAEHPAGAAAWSWWVANWAKFSWRTTNADAFKNMDNDLYRACAVHGPVRGSTPSFQTGWHQCEFRSLNGWSRSGLYNQALPSDQQEEKAFAVQPCFRMNTAMASNGPSPGHGTSMWRCGFEGGGTAVVAVPEQTFQPTLDVYSLGVGMVLDRMTFRALPGSKAAFTAKYGRVALRNSVVIFDGVAEDPQNLTVFGGADNAEPAGSANNYSYNNTFIFARDLMAVNPNTKFGFAKTNDRAPTKRMVVEWNNLVLRYAPIRNSGDFPLASTREPMADPLGIGRDYLPEVGSNVLAAASAVPVPFYDGNGNIRPTSAAVGAFELPALSVATTAELNALLSSATASGRTVELAPGNYGLRALKDGGTTWNDAFRSYTNSVAFRAANRWDKPVLDGFKFTSFPTGGPSAAITFKDVDFYRPRPTGRTRSVSPDAGTDTIIDFFEGSATHRVTFEGCKVESDYAPAGTGDLNFFLMTGMTMRGRNYRVHNCEIKNVGTGAALSGSNGEFTKVSIDGVQADGVVIGRSVGTITDGLLVENVNITGFGGCYPFLHSDGIQTTVGADLRNVTIRGVKVWAGDYLTNMIGLPDTGARADVVITGNTTLSVSSHANRWIRPNTTCTLTLPAASTCTGKLFLIYPSGGTTTVAATGGDTLNDGTFPEVLPAAASGYVSTGSGWTRHRLFRNAIWWDQNRTLDQWDSALSTSVNGPQIWVDATAGLRTITLPDVETVVGDVTAWKFVIVKADMGANAVRIAAQAGQTISLNGGAAANTLDLTVGARGVTLQRSGLNAWSATTTAPGVQGFFGQAAFYTGCRIEAPIIIVPNSTHGIGLQTANDPGDGLKINNATVLCPIPPDGSPFVLKPTFSYPNIQRSQSIVAGVDTLMVGGIAIGLLEATTPAAALALYDDYFEPTTQAGYYPITEADVLAMVRPKAGGPLDGTLIGAIGRSPTDGFWNYRDGKANPVSLAPTVTSYLPTVGGDALPGDSITLTFSQWIEKGTGNIDLWNESNNSLIEQFNAATSNRLAWTQGQGNGLVIDPTSDMPTANVSVRIPSGAVRGVYGTAFAGLAGSAYNFDSAPGFTDLIQVKDWNSVVWTIGPKGTISNGWHAAPGGATRADTNNSGATDWVLPVTFAEIVGQWLTAVVDIAPYPTSLASITIRPWFFGTGGMTEAQPTFSYNFNTSAASKSASAGAVGVINMGSYLRLWRTIDPAGLPNATLTRILIDAPNGAASNVQFSRPCLILGELNTSQITGLTASATPL